MDLKLRLLGDLQVYDMPYLSLYGDEASHTFYLAFRITFDKGAAADYIVVPVSAIRLLDYMHQKISVRNLYKESSVLLYWHKQRGVQGGLSLSTDRKLENRVDDIKYNPHLCEDEKVILDYLHGF